MFKLGTFYGNKSTCRYQPIKNVEFHGSRIMKASVCFFLEAQISWPTYMYLAKPREFLLLEYKYMYMYVTSAKLYVPVYTCIHACSYRLRHMHKFAPFYGILHVNTVFSKNIHPYSVNRTDSLKYLSP